VVAALRSKYRPEVEMEGEMKVAVCKMNHSFRSYVKFSKQASCAAPFKSLYISNFQLFLCFEGKHFILQISKFLSFLIFMKIKN
jgi:hypothetical protein